MKKKFSISDLLDPYLDALGNSSISENTNVCL